MTEPLNSHRRRAILFVIVAALLCLGICAVWTFAPASERSIISQVRARSPELDLLMTRYPNARVHVSYLLNWQQTPQVWCEVALFDRYVLNLDIHHKTNACRSRVLSIGETRIV